MSGRDAERWVDVESRLMHQDKLLGQLDEVVRQQQQQIARLEQQVTRLYAQLRMLQGDVPDERPPHY